MPSGTLSSGTSRTLLEVGRAEGTGLILGFRGTVATEDAGAGIRQLSWPATPYRWPKLPMPPTLRVQASLPVLLGSPSLISWATLLLGMLGTRPRPPLEMHDSPTPLASPGWLPSLLPKPGVQPWTEPSLPQRRWKEQVALCPAYQVPCPSAGLGTRAGRGGVTWIPGPARPVR